MTSRTVRAIVAVAVVASGAGGTVARPARAAAPALTQSWWVHRTSRKPMRLEMRITAAVRQASDTNEGMLFTLRVVPPGLGVPRFADYSVADAGREPLVRSYGVDGADPGCPALCDAMNATRLFDASAELGRSPLPSEWYVAAYNLDITITASTGWRVERIPNRLTLVRAPQSTATGVRSNNVTVEHFTRATASGGPYGSFAFAVIPCTTAGTGSASFHGGVSYHDRKPTTTMTCDEADHARSAAVAYGRTTWSLDGDVVGSTGWPLRLLVFSLPHAPRG